ncbi:anion permease [Streptomyces fractus]|uniref:inorganic phosphate transporter n=1 Tax=Streptomyces fractus TaxID=641806 RepID=UPI003CE7CB13
MDNLMFLVTMVVLMALAFDFTNGFHDTANAVAPSIASGALSPKAAVGISAACNFIGAFLSVEVAQTISGGIINESAGIQPEVVLAALTGAISWNLITWLRGIPSSSSHALYGGLIGATLVAVGTSGVNGGVVVAKILVPMIVAPFVAGAASWFATRITDKIAKKGDEATNRRGYRAGQVASAGLVSLAHGTNDAQKTMGVITLTLVTAGQLPSGSAPPTWVIAAAGLALALGTYSGGWRIIKTMGKDITELSDAQAASSQTASAAVILASSNLGFGLSTTQVCTGSVTGAGLGRKGGRVNWPMLRTMSATWLITLPAAAVVGGVAELVVEQGLWGQLLAVAGTIAVGLYVRVAARRDKVTADSLDATNSTAAQAA